LGIGGLGWNLPVVAGIVDFDLVTLVVVLQVVPLAQRDAVFDEGLAPVSYPLQDVVGFGVARV
jgi:hypothetical protein